MDGEQPGERSAGPGELPGPSAEVRREARVYAWLYTGAAVVLLPWIGLLAVTLPRRQFDAHYRAAWVGFDLLLILAIIRTAYMAFRVDPRIQLPATATATLLIVDAWFDITTSNRSQILEAVILAVLVEIPSALFSLYLARRVNRSVTEAARAGPYPNGIPAGPRAPHRAVGDRPGGAPDRT